MKWTIEKIQKAARRCKNRTQFHNRYKTAAEKARVLGMMDSLFGPRRPTTPLHVGRKRYWTDERLTEVARKYQTRGEFRLFEPGAYMAAYARNLLDKVCSHMKVLRTTYVKRSPNVKLIEFAARSCTNVSTFQKTHAGAYFQASRAGMLPELFKKEDA